MRRRLDLAMVRRKITESRTEAARLIDAGVVTVGGAPADKPSRLVGDDEPIEVREVRRWVGRGAEKLAGALEAFPIDVRDRSVLDAGASTGGFTECLLSYGARRVFAVDVGRNQIHERLLADERVISREKTDIRSVTPDSLPFPVSLVVADLSFISLTSVIPRLAGLVSPEPGHHVGELVLLVKPQFEVGRKEVSRGRGVVTDPALHTRALEIVTTALSEAGCVVLGTIESPVLGGEGNKEFLVHARVPTSGAPRP